MTDLTTTAAHLITARIDDLVWRFIDDRDVKPGSKRTYKAALKQFFTYVETENLDLSQISRPDLIRYKEKLLNDNKSILTIAGYLSGLRLFYEWAESHKLYPNIAKGIRAPREGRKFYKQPLTLTQSLELIRKSKSNVQTRQILFTKRGTKAQESARRDHAIILMLMTMGLRTVEIIRASVEDLTYKNGHRVINIQRKGHYDKSPLEVTDDVNQAIRDYLSTRGNPSRGPLFVSASNNSMGGRMTTRTVSHMAKQHLKSIGVDDRTITAHSLRHTAGVNLIRAGANITDVQHMLGHTSPSTTMLYLRTIADDKRLENSGESRLTALYKEHLHESLCA